ncbi:MAG: hypothetical protein ACE5JM_13475, partial [Armatimonadota bacterium]
ATAALCVAVRCWRDPYHCVYDVLTGLVVFSFVAQLVVEVVEGGVTAWWWGRGLLLAPIGGVSAGALLLGWEISGHLTGLFIVAGAQSLDDRLSAAVRVAYWVPAPIALWLRWSIFDRGVHTETHSAAVVAALCLVTFSVCRRILARRASSATND